MKDKDSVKVDVTSKIDGKFENGSIGLYLENARVGEITLTEDGNRYSMVEDYLFENNKIFRYENSHPENQKKYVDDCDMGWC